MLDASSRQGTWQNSPKMRLSTRPQPYCADAETGRTGSGGPRNVTHRRERAIIRRSGAFLLDAALLAAAANVAGSGGWPSSLATRTVTSFRLGSLFIHGTVSVICDISALI